MLPPSLRYLALTPLRLSWSRAVVAKKAFSSFSWASILGGCRYITANGHEVEVELVRCPSRSQAFCPPPSLFIVRDVEDCPIWSWEVEDVMEANLETLPNDISSQVAGGGQDLWSA